ADNESDGVWGSVLYPTLGFHLFRVQEHHFFSALTRAYNDWVAGFCAPYPDRLRGVAIINLDDVDEGVKEMQRARDMGLRACLFAVTPGEKLSYDDPRYEPAWATAQDLEMPIGLHVGAFRTRWAEEGFDKSSRYFATLRPNTDSTVRTSLTSMLWGG